MLSFRPGMRGIGTRISWPAWIVEDGADRERNGSAMRFRCFAVSGGLFGNPRTVGWVGGDIRLIVEAPVFDLFIIARRGRYSQFHKKTPALLDRRSKTCDSDRTQTCNLLIRSQMLYSIKLRSRFAIANIDIFGRIAKQIKFFFNFFHRRVFPIRSLMRLYR